MKRCMTGTLVYYHGQNIVTQIPVYEGDTENDKWERAKRHQLFDAQGNTFAYNGPLSDCREEFYPTPAA